MADTGETLTIGLRAIGAEETAAALRGVSTEIAGIEKAASASDFSSAFFARLSTQMAELRASLGKLPDLGVKVAPAAVDNLKRLEEQLRTMAAQAAKGVDFKFDPKRASEAKAVLDQVAAATRHLGSETKTASSAVESQLSILGKLTTVARQSFQQIANGTFSFSGLASSLGKVGLVAGGVVAGLALLGPVLQKLAEKLTAPIREAAEEEAALRKLNVALASLGQLSATATSRVAAYADSMQRASAYTDEQIIATSALIAQLTRLSGDSLERATGAAIQLGSLFGRDLTAAATALAREIEGTGGALSRWGVYVSDTVPKAQRFEAVLAAVGKFGNVAGADIKGLSGATAQLSSAWKDLQAALGKPLLRPLTEAANLASRALYGLSDAVKGFTSEDTRELSVVVDKAASDLVYFSKQGEATGERLSKMLSKLDKDLRPRIRFEVQSAPIENVDALLRSLGAASAEAARVGAAEWRTFFETLRREASEGIKVRFEADTAGIDRGRAMVEEVLRKAPVGEARFRVEPENVKRIREELRTAEAEAKAAIEEANRAALAAGRRAMAAGAEVAKAAQRDSKLAGTAWESTWKVLAPATRAAFGEVLADLGLVTREIEAQQPKFSVGMEPAIDAAEFRRRVDELIASRELVAEVSQKVKIDWSGLDVSEDQIAEKLAVVDAELEKLGKRAGTEALALKTLFLAARDALSSIGDAKATLRISTEGAADLSEIARDLRGIREEASAPLRLAPLDGAKTNAEAIAAIRAEWRDLVALGKGESLDKAAEKSAEALDALAKKFPKLKAEALALRAEIVGERPEIEVLLKTKLATDQAKAFRKAILDIVAVRGGELAVFDEAKLLSQLTTARELVAEWKRQVDAALSNAAPSEYATILQKITALQEDAVASIGKYAPEARSSFREAELDARKLLGRYQTLDVVQRKLSEVEILLELKKWDEALATIAQVRGMVTAIPESKEIELRIRGAAEAAKLGKDDSVSVETVVGGLDRARKDLDKLWKEWDGREIDIRARFYLEAAERQLDVFAKDARLKISEALGESGLLSVAASSMEAMTSLLMLPWDAFVDKTRTAADIAREIFAKLARDILAALAKVAAFNLLASLFPGSGVIAMLGRALGLGKAVGGTGGFSGLPSGGSTSAASIQALGRAFGTAAIAGLVATGGIGPSAADARILPVEPVSLRVAVEDPPAVRIKAPAVAVDRASSAALLQGPATDRLARRPGVPATATAPVLSRTGEALLLRDLRRAVEAPAVEVAVPEAERLSVLDYAARTPRSSTVRTLGPVSQARVAVSSTDLASRFLPKSAAQAVVVNITATDALDVEKSFRRGPLGRALSNVIRSGRL